MGRWKYYATAAARQAAYRRRLREETLVVDRHNLECLDRRLARLHEAITMAMGQGDPLARRVRCASVDSTLDKLTAVFLERAQGTK